MGGTKHQSASDAKHQKLYRRRREDIKLTKTGTTENMSVYKIIVGEKNPEFNPGRCCDSP